MSDHDESANPYGTAVAVKNNEGGVAVQASRAATEVQAQVVMARQFPRDPLQATERILSECDIPELANVALYSYPRGGTQVEGPSIRLAEVLKRHWGNMMSGTIEVDRAGDTSSLLTYAWDLETNVMSRKEFKVKHVRDSNRGGKQQVTEERDIYEVAANAGARRERACILALIPGHVVNAAVARCKKTMQTKIGDVHAAAERMVAAFEAEFKVSKVQIEKRLHHRLDSISAAEIVSLGQIYNSLRDGYAGVEDYFEAVEQGPAPTTTVDKARAAAAKAAGKPQEQTSSPIEAAKAIVLSYINEMIPAADRQAWVKDLGMAKTPTAVEDLYRSMTEKYGEPELFGGEETK